MSPMKTPDLHIRSKIAAALALVLFVTACATAPENPNLTLQSDSLIQSSIEEQTQNKKIYDGFMNIMDVSATLQNSKVSAALLDQSAKIYQWDENGYANEKTKMQTQLAKETEIFLSFFVPERKWDDLHKAGTRWKLFLDVNGKRYEGKAKRWKADLSEVRAMFPHHTRWNTPYRLTFPIPTTEIENFPAKLTLTGPVGNMQLEFPPVALTP